MNITLFVLDYLFCYSLFNILLCRHKDTVILCLWFRASLIYIINWPTRRNTKQSIYYSASSLCMFRVPTIPVISTQNCNYSLRYRSYFFVQLAPSNVTKLAWPVPETVVTVLCTPDGWGWHPKHVDWTCRIIKRLLCVASRWTIINTAILITQQGGFRKHDLCIWR